MLTFSCPHCAKALRVKDELAGKKTKCPGCQQVFAVPASSESLTAARSPAGKISAVSVASHDLAEEQTIPPRDAPPPALGADAPTTPPEGGANKGERTDTFGAEMSGGGQKPEEDTEFTDFLAPPQNPDEIGRLGPYRVLKVLGKGGMGVVFRAEDPALQRIVAIKAMLPGLAASGTAKQRFLREARAAASLHDDHVVSIYQVGEDRGAPFLAMEFLEGEPLDVYLQRQAKLPIAEIVRIGRETALGLAAAHKRGLIHRDIKPANLWLEASPGRESGEFRVKILDFGLARATSENTQLTNSGVVVGTPAFMAPEQAGGKTVDHRCDLFSLGCVLYRLCTGTMAFKGNDTMAILMALATETPTSPQLLNFEVPAELSDLVLQLLAKDPDQRPATARDVADKLEAIGRRLAANAPTAFLPTTDLPPPPQSRKDKAGKRSRALLAISFGLLGLLVAGAVYYWQTNNGTVRLEINDPDIKVVFDKNGPTISGVDKHDIKLTPGEFGLTVERGDLKFQTDKFILKRGETITLKIEWFKEGKLQVVQGDKVIGAKELAKVDVAVGPPVVPGNYALWFDGDRSFVEIPSLRVAALKEWCVEAKIAEDEVPAAGPQGTATVASEGQLMSLHRGSNHSGFNTNGMRISGPGTKVTHLAAVRTGDELRFFVNGKRSNQGQLKGPDALDLAQPFRLGATRLDLKKGLERFFKGTIDEVRVSKVARYDKDFTPAKRFEPDADTLALYHFDEGAGDVLKDSSGNGHHGKIVGAKWVKADGSPISPARQDDFALSFGGKSHVILPSSLSSAPFTLEAHVIPAEDIKDNGLHPILTTDSYDTDLFRSKSHWSARINAGKNRFAAVSEEPMVPGKKVHLASVFTGKQIKLFVDGKLKQTTEVTGAPNRTNQAPFFIGYPTDSFPGIIDEVRISKVARYDIDFAPAQRFEPDADTLALYHFDEGAGDVLKDSSGNGHHGKIVGAKWVKADGSPIAPPAAYALSFEEKNSATLPAGVELVKPFTLEAYITPKDTKQRTFFLYSSPEVGLLAGPKWGFWLDKSRIDSVGDVVPGKKTHVAGVYTGEQIRFYVDGVLIQSKEIKFAPPIAAPRTLTISNPQWMFAGTVSGIRISQSARYDKNFVPQARFTTDADTLALYHCDEGAGDVLKDSSGNGHHGKIVGAKWVKADGTPIAPSKAVNPPPFVLLTFGEKEAKKQQDDWAAKLKLPVEAENKIGMKLRLIPPGDGVAKPIYLGKYEVTQGEWQQVMGYNPSEFGPNGPRKADVEGMDTSKFPVENVNWFDSAEFCNKLSEREGLKPYYQLTVARRLKDGKHIEEAAVKILGGSGYHIPTDAEWELGCRAGTKTKYHCGDKDEDVLDYAWIDKNSDGRTHAVGEKKSNAFGLYDMHGNVHEWNEEMLTNAETGAPERVIRGGSWRGPAGECALNHRFRRGPAYRFDFSSLLGLRVARVADGSASVAIPPLDPAWVPLFNGKDLTGWKTHPSSPGQWKVEDGLLIGNGPKQNYLFSERGDYENFHFRVEAMINAAGNSGQFFRAPFGPGLPKGYEAQISLSDKPQQTGSLFDIVKIAEPLHKPDEWFTQEVIADGDHIRILVNDKLVVDTHSKLYSKGHFALQLYSAATVVKFRKIEVKELPK